MSTQLLQWDGKDIFSLSSAIRRMRTTMNEQRKRKMVLPPITTTELLAQQAGRPGWCRSCDEF